MTRSTTRSLSRLAVRATVLTICLMWSVPTVGLLISSLRPAADVQTSGWWTALLSLEELSELTLENYRLVLTQQDMGRSFLNTASVTLPTTILNLGISTFAAYGFTWIRFRGRRLLFLVFIVALLVVPLQLAFLPMLQLFNLLGISGTFPSIWLAHTAFGLPINIFLLHNFLSALPGELIDAAHVDGASHWQTFWRVALPLSLPAIASVTIFQFLSVWNDLLIALVFLGGSPDVRVMTLNLQLMLGSRGQDWHLLTAGAFITMVVPLAVFFALQRYFVRGIAAGAVKG